MEEESVAHSPALTKDIAVSIRDLLREDDEGELDPYDAIINGVGGGSTFKLTNTETELQYLVTIAPVED
jgi:hypothetical protein